MPENSASDIGAAHMSTARAQRIDEMIRTGIEKGKKFTIHDMKAIQQDDTDIIAREITPSLI